jgi:hypothetical protein
VLGRTATRDISAGTPLSWEMIREEQSVISCNEVDESNTKKLTHERKRQVGGCEIHATKDL